MSRWSVMAVLLVVGGSLAEVSAQEVRVEGPSQNLVEVSGGIGESAWRLRYGTFQATRYPARIVRMGQARAYFTHGPWLRLLDTDRGIVVGRWLFPNIIDEIVEPRLGAPFRIRIKMPAWAGKQTEDVMFDPAAGEVPAWDVGGLLALRWSETEAFTLLNELSGRTDAWSSPIPDAARVAATVEDMVKRDAASPWLRCAWGKVLRDARDSRAAGELEACVRVAARDFREGFRIAAWLERLPQPETELAVAAYEGAYADFIRKDKDPRYFDALLTMLILYPRYTSANAVPDVARLQRIERTYRLAPNIEGAERAWALLADYLQQQGATDAARVWRERAGIARRESLHSANLDIQLVHDRSLLVALGSLLATFLVVAILSRKYAPQRRLDKEAARRSQRPRGFGFLNLEYSSRHERAALVIFAAVAWLAVGLASVYLRVALYSLSGPYHVGEIGGPDDIAHLRDRAPASSERDLLLAIAYHSTGELAEAERRYRLLPQYAESWNNLGVILTRTGRIDEATQAFSRSLAVLPSLAEAVLNTGGPPRGLAAEMHQKYAPDQKMIAVPSRETVLRAHLGGVWSGRHWRMLLGPLPDLRNIRVAPGSRGFIPTGLTRPFALLIAILAVALWAVPFRPVALPPSRAVRLLEHVVPGIGPSWQWSGGPLLLLWSTLLLVVVLGWALGTPYVLTVMWQPGLLRAFELPSGAARGFFEDINPPIAALAAIVVAMVAVNYSLVRRALRRIG